MINELIYKHLTFKNVIFFVAFILIILFAFANPDIAMMLFASIVIACSLNPLVKKMNKKFNRSVAAGIVLGSFIILLCIFLLPIFIIGIYEIGSFLDSISKYLASIDNLLETYPILKRIGLDNLDFSSYFVTIANHAGEMLNGAINLARSLGSAFVYLFIMIIFTYFFMADTNTVKKTFLRFFPISARARIETIVSIIAQKMGGYVVAQFYAIVSVGIVMTIGLLMFGVNYAILLGLITAILDIIPVVGPTIALIICLIATAQSGWLPIIGVVVSFAAAQLIENNIVRPYFFSKLLNIHPMLIFFFLFIGAKYFGVLGALFAPAIASCICVLIEELYMKNIE